MGITPEVVLHEGCLQNMVVCFRCTTGKWANFIKDKLYVPYTCMSRKNKYGEYMNCAYHISDEDGDAMIPRGGFEKVITYTVKDSLSAEDVKQMKRLNQRIISLEGNANKAETVAYLKCLYAAYCALI